MTWKTHPITYITGFLFMSSYALSASGAPEKVILIRHAEKHIGSTSLNSLSVAGLKRSINIAYMIHGCFGKPTLIWVYPFNTQTGSHARSYQTSIPLAVASRLNPVFLPNFKGSANDAGKMIRELSRSEHPLVVVIWDHTSMPALAKGLGWNAMKPITENNFDNLYEFNYLLSEINPIVKVKSQSKLFTKQCSSDHSILSLES